jgi:hypothetical protein
LGTGKEITAALTVGSHLLTLTATDSDGMSTDNTVQVTVVADFDRDGLGDAYEKADAALAWWNPADAGQDFDDDGLTNRSEAAWGTSPGNADSDGDGAADGVEVNSGSSPLDPSSQPAPQQLLISRTALEYRVASNTTLPLTGMIFLMTSLPQTTTWTASENIPWLSITPSKGTTYGRAEVEIDVAQLDPGVHLGIVTFVPGLGIENVSIPVRVEVVTPPAIAFPLRLPRIQNSPGETP